MKKSLFVGGTFNGSFGKYSKLADQIFQGLSLVRFDYFNGGSFEDLEKIAESVENYSSVFWFPYIPEEKTEITRRLKRKTSSFTLTTSKRNLENKFGFADLVYFALQNRSNLYVEFNKEKGLYHARVLDVLGNVYLNYSPNMNLVGNVLKKRSEELSSYNRVSSSSVGKEVKSPENTEFFSRVSKYANVFHDLIHPKNTERFLGNASFRCERGFPSFRENGLVFVSQRNIDKREIGKDSFVAVKEKLPVEYFGNKKPSVDTPIQIRLYNNYRNVNYMLHSHTYVSGAVSTKRLLPCGAVEEADEIMSLFPDKNETNFAVNLRGHGSLVLVSDPKNLDKINYQARKMPEVQNDYL